jgi:hypothetical protein
MKKIKRSQLREMILESLNEENLPSMNIEQQELINNISSIEKQLKELAQKLAVLSSRVAGAE